MLVNIVTLEEVREMLLPLQKRIADLERQLSKRSVGVCKMNEAVKILGVSNVQVGRLIGVGIIKKARKSGRPWYFDRQELNELSEHPERMDLTNRANFPKIMNYTSKTT